MLDLRLDPQSDNGGVPSSEPSREVSRIRPASKPLSLTSVARRNVSHGVMVPSARFICIGMNDKPCTKLALTQPNL